MAGFIRLLGVALQAHVDGCKDIQELCDEYYIEPRHIDKLNELMKDRRRMHVSDPVACEGTPRGMMTCVLAIGVLPSNPQEKVEGNHGGG